MNSEEEMKDFTRIYENVRYGDRVPGSSEIYTAEQDFKNIMSQYKRSDLDYAVFKIVKINN